MKPGNELCTSTESIDTLEECKAAINSLGLNFTLTESKVQYPKGCYAYNGGPNSYWNTHISGGKSSPGHPICKKGETI